MTIKTSCIAALAASGIFISSCSKSDDTAVPSLEGKNYKFTISAPGISPGSEGESDYLTFVVVGGASGGNTMWKVNGEVRSNEQGITITDDMLQGGGTFVIESVTPLRMASVGIEAINFDTPFTLNYVAEVDGEVQNETHENVTSDYARDYTY